jgi:hypothetical protein
MTSHSSSPCVCPTPSCLAQFHRLATGEVRRRQRPPTQLKDQPHYMVLPAPHRTAHTQRGALGKSFPTEPLPTGHRQANQKLPHMTGFTYTSLYSASYLNLLILCGPHPRGCAGCYWLTVCFACALSLWLLTSPRLANSSSE